MDVFESKPWLLDSSPNAVDAANCGMSWSEYGRRHAEAKVRHAAARDEAAGRQAIEHTKGAIRSLQAAAVRTRALAATREQRGRGDAHSARWAVADLEHRTDRKVDNLRYLVRGLSKREQRQHLADVGLKS